MACHWWKKQKTTEETWAQWQRRKRFKSSKKKKKRSKGSQSGQSGHEEDQLQLVTGLISQSSNLGQNRKEA